MPSISVKVFDTSVSGFAPSVTSMNVTKTIETIPYTIRLTTIPYYPVTVRAGHGRRRA